MDTELLPIYECCIRHNKPIIFHAGISLEPETNSKYAMPLLFEEVALQYSNLRFCLAHFGWPWVNETAALLLKYPNIYTDTGLLYFDSAASFMIMFLKPTWENTGLTAVSVIK